MSETTASGSGGSVVNSAIKIAGEGLVAPGASLVLDGNISAGVLHVAGGFLAKALIGPVGWILVAANSYSTSVTGRPLHQHLSGPKKATAGDDAN